MPLTMIVLLALVVLHILALHETGSLGPDGIEIKQNKGPDGIPLDGVAFHPYLTSKDLVAQYLLLYSFSGDPDDFDEIVDYDYQHANVAAGTSGRIPS